MIIRANTKVKNAIHTMWKNIFAHDDGGYTDYYFKEYYQNSDTFVKQINDEVVGCACKHPHSVVINGRMLRCSMIVGIAVKEEHRGKGYMNELMEAMLDEADHQELITMIQAYNPELYKKYGFEEVYRQRIWDIKKENIKKITPKVTQSCNAEDFLALYGKFVSRFSGYVIRDLEYYQKYFNEIKAQNGRILAHYNNEELEGYIVVFENDNALEIKECIYLTSNALLHLMNSLVYKNKNILLYTSDSENMEIVFPNSTFEIKPYTLVRLNNKELFNRLYNCEINTAQEAMSIVDKPLFMNESR